MTLIIDSWGFADARIQGVILRPVVEGHELREPLNNSPRMTKDSIFPVSSQFSAHYHPDHRFFTLDFANWRNPDATALCR